MPHYFDSDPAVASDPTDVLWSLPDGPLRITTDRGVFGHGRVDAGTKLLLISVPLPAADGDLLDLGCGAGAIALTLARRSPSARVWAVDVNQRALALTDANAASNRIDNVRTALPEQVPPEVRFRTIWSNPPIRIGKAALHDLLISWLDRLTPDGEAHLVVQRHLGADSLARWLTEQGFGVERAAVGAGFRVLRVRPRQVSATITT